MKTINYSRLTLYLLLVLALLLTACAPKVSLQEEVPPTIDSVNNSAVVAPAEQQQEAAPQEQPAEQPAEAQPADGAAQDLVDAGNGEDANAEAAPQEEAPQEQPAEQPAETAPEPAQETAPVNDGYPRDANGNIIHIVKPRDTVGSIANAYGVSIQAIVSANGLFNENFISVDQELVIPPADGSAIVVEPTNTDDGSNNTGNVGTGFDPNNYRTHIVTAGQSLGFIAQSYGFTIDELAAYNGLADINRIDVNDEIRIPNR